MNTEQEITAPRAAEWFILGFIAGGLIGAGVACIFISRAIDLGC